MKTDYQKQALKFLEDTNSSMAIEFLKNDFHFNGDKEKRDIYKITIKRGNREFSFNFGNSIAASGFAIANKNGKVLRRFNVDDTLRAKCMEKGFGFGGYSHLLPFPISQSEKIIKPIPPDEYDVLACLTKYDPGTFENFCGDFGYDEDSRSAEKTYNAVLDEYKNLCRLYSDDEIELMQEIY